MGDRGEFPVDASPGQTSRCPVCAGRGVNLPDDHVHGNSRYNLAKCDRCGVFFWWPLVFPQATYYESHDSYVPRHLNITQIQGNHKKFLKKYRRYPGTLLDIGCANGSFIKEAQAHGFDVYGIDIDGVSIKASRDRGLGNTFQMGVDEFSEYAVRKNLGFDYITIFEVIEHQTKPVEFMNPVKRMLKPGGILYGSVPNRNRYSWLLREEGKNYEGVDYPPHHFTLWDENSLRNFFRSTGFEGEYSIVDEMDRYNVIINKTGIYELIKKLKRSLFGIEKAELPLEGNLPATSHRFKALSLTRDIYDLLVTLVFSPYFFVATLTHRGVRIVFDLKARGEGGTGTGVHPGP